MKKYDQIHETVLKSIFDMYEDIKSLTNGELADMINKHRNSRVIRSIARSSSDLICVFPVLTSRNISIDVQAMVSKAIEKNCVSMLQMLFSAIQLSDAKDAYQYINTFHTNINKSSKLFDMDDVIAVSDMIGITHESALQVGGKVDPAVINQIKEDMRNLNFYFESSNVNPIPLENKFRCNLDPNGQYIVEAQVFTEDDKYPMENLDGSHDPEEELPRSFINLKHRKSAVSGKNAAPSSDYRTMKTNSMDKRTLSGKDKADITKTNVEMFGKQVLNTEYKKANELMPTLMVINFKSKNGDNYESVDSVVIGVKAKLYPISSEDMITHVVAKTKDANWVQKFIKASTREISFFKDFLFGIDKAKIDALSMSRKGSANKMWKILERRAAKSKWNKLMASSSTDATAITTIVMSQSEVDFIKKEYQIDISDVYNTRILMEQYNLLGICIVDESLEIAKFMWDTGEDLWETVAFNGLERESNDNTYKKVVNLMTKVM